MEDNKKIVAEFMECKNFKDYGNNFTFEHPTKTKIEWSNRFQDNTETNIFSTTFDPFYNNDWNWLMEVVEKIESIKIKDYSITTNITDCKTYISVYHYGEGGKWSILISNLNEKYKDFNKIQRTYKAIMEFINFYNKQKEE